jgi:DNA-directed RNA polymerase specialized sigma24 family protein
MADCIAVQRTRIVKVSSKPIKKPPQRLPWPRKAEDDVNVDLGVNVQAKRQDVIKIVHKYFRVSEVSMDELLQEVFLAIIHKNYTKSAHDPRKSSFGHYVYMVANNVCINLAHRKKRYDKERDSIDTPYGDDDRRTLLDTADVAIPDDDDIFGEKVEEIETLMRQQGMRDLARYLRVVRTGASPDVIREALTWGNRKVSSKTIRDIRSQVRTALLTLVPTR